jgi:hypothetical protein
MYQKEKPQLILIDTPKFVPSSSRTNISSIPLIGTDSS